jgi:hypothetical protein
MCSVRSEVFVRKRNARGSLLIDREDGHYLRVAADWPIPADKQRLETRHLMIKPRQMLPGCLRTPDQSPTVPSELPTRRREPRTSSKTLDMLAGHARRSYSPVMLAGAPAATRNSMTSPVTFRTGRVVCSTA